MKVVIRTAEYVICRGTFSLFRHHEAVTRVQLLIATRRIKTCRKLVAKWLVLLLQRASGPLLHNLQEIVMTILYIYIIILCITVHLRYSLCFISGPFPQISRGSRVQVSSSKKPGRTRKTKALGGSFFGGSEDRSNNEQLDLPEKGRTKASIPSAPIFPQRFFTHRLFTHRLFPRSLSPILLTRLLFTH
jgi:hypothetical protein